MSTIRIQGPQSAASDMDLAVRMLRKFGHQVLVDYNDAHVLPASEYHDLSMNAGGDQVRNLLVACTDIYLRITQVKKGMQKPRILLRITDEQVSLVYCAFEGSPYKSTRVDRAKFLDLLEFKVHELRIGYRSFRNEIDGLFKAGELVARPLTSWKEVVTFLGGWDGSAPASS